MEEDNPIQELYEMLYILETDYPGSPLTEALKEVIKAKQVQDHKALISIF